MSALIPHLQNLRAVSRPRHLKRSVALGLKSLWMRKLRSLLTALGIVFGVCSVIAMLAIGEGASYEAQQQIVSLGSQNIIIQSVKPPENRNATETETIYFTQYGLTYRDIEQIRRTIPGISVVVPARSIPDYVWNLGVSIESDIKGTVPWYPSMKYLPMETGRFFGDIEMESRANVCVINETLAHKLFPLSAPLHQDVRISGTRFRVIGITKDNPGSTKGASTASAVGGEDSAQNQPTLIMPLATLYERFGDVLYKPGSGDYRAEKVELSEITVKVDDANMVVASANAIRHILEKNHDDPDYSIIVPIELLRQAERTKKIFSIVLGSIAAISLLVGGIGIMNIMLANVTERTREIGIRRALGAKRADIVLQFLIETVILSGAGGLLGVILGLFIPWIVSKAAGMITIVSFGAPALAFTISVLIGIVFGIYPAIRASQMHPVQALRHE
jgi:putative ABC transport system permease protein